MSSSYQEKKKIVADEKESLKDDHNDGKEIGKENGKNSKSLSERFDSFLRKEIQDLDNLEQEIKNNENHKDDMF